MSHLIATAIRLVSRTRTLDAVQLVYTGDWFVDEVKAAFELLRGFEDLHRSVLKKTRRIVQVPFQCAYRAEGVVFLGGAILKGQPWLLALLLVWHVDRRWLNEWLPDVGQALGIDVVQQQRFAQIAQDILEGRFLQPPSEDDE